MDKRNKLSYKMLGLFILSLSVIMVGCATDKTTDPKLEIETQVVEEGSPIVLGETQVSNSRIPGIYKVDTRVTGGDVVMLYDINELHKELADVPPTQFLSTLKQWEYTNSPDENSPLDTIAGSSNCQGITMYIMEWFDVNYPQDIYDLDLWISAEEVSGSKVLHTYAMYKSIDGNTYKIDMVKDKEEAIAGVEKVISDIGK